MGLVHMLTPAGINVLSSSVPLSSAFLTCFHMHSLENFGVMMALPHLSVSELSKQDRIVIVMGSTGAGKSSYIDIATNQRGGNISHELESHTLDIRPVRVKHPTKGDYVVFVDTPGFDGTNRTEAQTLSLIAEWLVKGHKHQVKLAGILYLHPISLPRMGGSALRGLAIFSKICGIKAMPNVVLVTTFWTGADEGTGERRESELKDNFWKEMVCNGCRTRRFEGNSTSAWNIADLVLENPPVTLKLVDELVSNGKQLSDTAAGVVALKGALFRLFGGWLPWSLRKH